MGRRGPLQAAFTTLELRELATSRRRGRRGRPGGLRGHHRRGCRGRGQDRAQQHQGVAWLRGQRALGPGHRRIVFRFRTSPIEIRGDGAGRVNRAGPQRAGRRRERTGGRPRTPASARTLPAQLVVRAVGYRGVPIPGCRSTRARRPSRTPTAGSSGSRNEYVVGWIKRGPSGVIGTNKKDSQDTVDTLVADLAGANAGRIRDDHAEKLADWLAGGSRSWSPTATGSSSTSTNGQPVSRTDGRG